MPTPVRLSRPGGGGHNRHGDEDREQFRSHHVVGEADVDEDILNPDDLAKRTG
jgi:hypothetical protein